MRYGLTPEARKLSDKGQEIVRAYIKIGSKADVATICGVPESEVHYLLSTPAGGAALRAELMRQLATDGGSIGYRALKQVAEGGPFVPAAARVAAAKVLLQAAGLIEAPAEGRDGKPGKSLSEMTRSELLAFMNAKRAEIDQVERELGDRATPINAPVTAPSAPKAS